MTRNATLTQAPRRSLVDSAIEQIRTQIESGAWRVGERTNANGEKGMAAVEVTLNDWMFRSIVQDRRVLTINREYFRLTQGLQRRLYELARKHCGVKDEWKIGLELLQKKCGSNSPLRVLRALVKKVCEHDADHGHFPDYAVTMNDDVILFRNRSGLKSKPDQVAIADAAPYIDPETMHDATDRHPQ